MVHLSCAGNATPTSLLSRSLINLHVMDGVEQWRDAGEDKRSKIMNKICTDEWISDK